MCCVDGAHSGQRLSDVGVVAILPGGAASHGHHVECVDPHGVALVTKDVVGVETQASSGMQEEEDEGGRVKGGNNASFDSPLLACEDTTQVSAAMSQMPSDSAAQAFWLGILCRTWRRKKAGGTAV